MPSITCPICKKTPVSFFTSKRKHALYRCRNCSLIFVWPTPQTISHIYSRDYFKGAEMGHGYLDYEHNKKPMRKTFQKYLREIEKYASPKGKLLDIGAATGLFLYQAQKRGWQGAGIDISKYAVEIARANNLPVVTGTLEDELFTADHFDVITLWDVLEHLPTPHKNIAIMHRLLKKNGLLVINTPDSQSFFAHLAGKRWHLLIPPEHLFLYNYTALRILLEENNFKILTTKKIGKLFMPSYILTILRNWQGNPLWNMAAKLSQKSFLDKLAIPINLHDNMFVIAQKQ